MDNKQVDRIVKSIDGLKWAVFVLTTVVYTSVYSQGCEIRQLSVKVEGASDSITRAIYNTRN